MKQKQNIIIGLVGIVIVGIVVAYFYSAEQVKIKGFAFGNELEEIQDELKKLTANFDSKMIILREGDLTTTEFLEYSKGHIEKMEELTLRYDSLRPPETFVASVDLFRLSTQSQLMSDKHAIEWIKTGDENELIRSDSLLQEAFEYELAALEKYNIAKSGIAP